MKVSELIAVLTEHADKDITVGFLAEKDGQPVMACGPFNIAGIEEGIVIVPQAFISDKPKQSGLTKAMLEKLVPEIHLKRTKKIAESVDEIVRYMEEHNLMADVNIKSGQKNDERYFAYAIQAYHMGALK